MSNVHDFIQTQEFATLPAVVTKILELLESEEVDIRAVSGLIEADAPLTLKLLRVANSPLYALRSEVSSIHQAILHLGLNRLTNIVIGVSIFSKFLLSKNKSINSLLEEFWWHSSCVGMISKSLTVKTGKFYKENEFIGGLLHDIGKLALIQYDVDKYIEVIRLVEEEQMQDLDAEQKVFNTDHTIVGSEIAKLWKLPAELYDIITYHERLDDLKRNRELVSTVRIADLLAEIWGAGFHEGLRTVIIENESAWKLLLESYPELNEIDLELLTFELEIEFKKTVDFLKLVKS
ncbi:MAG: HDOD domain-containing protein [Candidatus Kapabacteria bacterium]|nr:HDOD domain-containing protein [Ignavibacteriota bacterium]MCW5884630.1 HDOD domain-containing protein [Candidatus Kapabacteria bacterium]